MYEYLGQRAITPRAEVLRRFHRDDAELVRGVLQDLVDGGLVFRSGNGVATHYRVVTGEELDAVRAEGADTDGIDALVWAIVYRAGPLDRAALASHVALAPRDLDAAIERLAKSGRVEVREGAYRAGGCVIPLGTAAGWEAAVFDHFQAVVATICKKLRDSAESALPSDEVGGSTYTFEVWPGHPLEAEARGQLRSMRERLSDLRRRVAEHNAEHAMPEKRSRVVVYGGQSVEQHEEESDERHD